MNTSPLQTLRTLAGTAIRVSPLCLGTMTFGNPIGEAEATRLVAHALDAGVNFFDTSNAYEGYDRSFGSAGGVGEELLGKALAGRRHDAVICTKFANPVGFGPFDAGLSARHLECELEKSLRRLQTDYIDVVLAHRWDVAANVDAVWNVFDRWVRAGKVLAVGTSNWPVWRMTQSAQSAAAKGLPPLSVSSPKYNLLNREIELEHLPCAAEFDISLVTHQPFQGGLLTGKYRRGMPPPSGSRGAEKPDWLPTADDALFDRLDALKALADETGLSVPAYVVSWLLSRPRVASVVMGCRNQMQLDSVLGAAQATFPAAHNARIDELFPSPKPRAGEAVLSWDSGKWVLADREPCTRL